MYTAASMKRVKSVAPRFFCVRAMLVYLDFNYFMLCLYHILLVEKVTLDCIN